MTLHLAVGVDLPDELAAQKNAILAMSGAGKSNTAVVLAEEMHAAGIPWVAIDPKGDWYGVRASADAKKPGLPIPVLGGLHGDVPLEPTGGKLVGNLIADSRLTCVLDVSEFDTRQDQYRFLADLGETLLKANRDPLHLFLEEADEYLPQSAREKGHLPRCLGAWQRVVKRGRFRGLGTTLISQRSAALNKDVLNQTDTLIAMRVTAPLDRKAVQGWVTSTGRDATELLESLPTLEDGEAWIWSPQRLKLVERIHVRRRATYDSGATPLLGQAAAKAATLVDVDLDVLKDQMAETIERAKADDPDELRAQLRERDAQIRELDRELTRVRAETPEPIVETVEVQIVDAEISLLLEQHVNEIKEWVTRGEIILSEYATDAHTVQEQLGRAIAASRAAEDRAGAAAMAPPPATPRPAPARPPARPAPPPDAAGITGYVPTAGALRMLEALARFPNGLSKSQLGTLAKVKKSGGTFGTYASRLRGAGLIVVAGDHHQITDAGIALVGTPAPTDPAELRADWAQRLGGEKNGGRRMYDLLVDRYPEWMTFEELQDRAEISQSGGSWGTYLSRLRTNELIEERDSHVRAHPHLFMEG